MKQNNKHSFESFKLKEIKSTKSIFAGGPTSGSGDGVGRGKKPRAIILS